MNKDMRQHSEKSVPSILMSEEGYNKAVKQIALLIEKSNNLVIKKRQNRQPGKSFFR